MEESKNGNQNRLAKSYITVPLDLYSGSAPVKSGLHVNKKQRNITQKRTRKETENKNRNNKRNKTLAEVGTKPPLAGIADSTSSWGLVDS